MLRRRLWMVPLIVVSGCSNGPEADLQYIGQARSAAAEWALVNEEAGQAKLTPTYVRSMHRWLRDEVRSASSALAQPNSPYGHEIAGLLQQPDDAPPEALRRRSDALKQIEDSLESA